MEYKVFSKTAFLNYLYDTDFNRQVKKIVLHKLWRKPKNVFWGEKSIKGLDKYYKKQGREFAFHIAIKNNDVWLCKNLNEKPDQSGNKYVNIDAIAVEIDAVIGGREPSKESWETYLYVVQKLMERFDLSPNNIYLHGDFYTTEQRKRGDIQCPGFTKEFFLEEMNKSEYEEFDIDYIKEDYEECFDGEY